jgi:predicted flap endonuclease-1-like 5' DNA nuclease
LGVCKRKINRSVKGTKAETALVTIFAFAVAVTLIVPSLPPAQLLYDLVRMQTTTLVVWGLPLANLINGVTNGFFWLAIGAAVFGVYCIFRESPQLPPMPKPHQLVSPPPANPIVDSRTNKIPPAITVSPVRKKRLFKKVVTQTEIAPALLAAPPESRIDILTIEGIGPIYSTLLRKSGVHTVADLLKRGATESGRQILADKVGVTSAILLKWVHRGDLLRVTGVGSKYSALLESAGVNTVSELSRKDPHYLCLWLKTINSEKKLVSRTPPSTTIATWVRYAQQLEPLVVH